MKYLPLLLLICLFGCKKSSPEQELFDKPIPVHFKIRSFSNALKHVHAELWACDQHGENKSLIEAKDTMFYGNADVVIVQNRIPYIYCYTAMTVQSDSFDINGVTIEIPTRGVRMNGSSCFTDHFEYALEFDDLIP